MVTPPLTVIVPALSPTREVPKLNTSVLEVAWVRLPESSPVLLVVHLPVVVEFCAQVPDAVLKPAVAALLSQYKVAADAGCTASNAAMAVARGKERRAAEKMRGFMGLWF
jgi:hypothetical protein